VIAPGAGDLAPLAIGATLMVMIFAGGHVSGGALQPGGHAGGVPARAPVRGGRHPYWIAQVAGAARRALLVLFMKGNPEVVPCSPTWSARSSPKFLYTFALCYVVLNVATAKGTSGNPTYGLAIGFTVLSVAYAVGGVSGGAFNPAVAVGITMMGLASMVNLWIYFAANLAGGAAAALVFKAMHPLDR
jgi:aquaporin Z